MRPRAGHAMKGEDEMGKRSGSSAKVLAPAAFWRRGAAFAFDWYVGALATSLPIAFVASMQGREVTDQLISTFAAPYGLYEGIAGLLAGLVYYAVVPMACAGQTLGKRLLHVRIVAADGSEASPVALAVRQVLGMMLIEGAAVGTSTVIRGLVEIATGAVLPTWAYAVSFAITLASVAIFAFRRDGRSLHDLLAGTMVVDA